MKTGTKLYTEEQVISILKKYNDYVFSAEEYEAIPSLPEPAMVIWEEPVMWIDENTGGQYSLKEKKQLIDNGRYKKEDFTPLWKHPDNVNKLKVADMRELQKKVVLGEISYTKMVELINEFKTKTEE